MNPLPAMATMKSTLTMHCIARPAAAAFVLLAWLLQAIAQQAPTPPNVLAYEGFLTNPAGVPIGSPSSTNITAVFRIYDAATAGNALWTEQHTLTITEGHFQVLLGEGAAYASEPKPPLSSIFLAAASSDRHVEVTLKAAGGGGSDLTIMPRSRLTPSPWTFLAARARTAASLVNHLNAAVISTSSGRVGINKPDPTEALDVAGTITAVSASATSSANLGTTVTASSLSGKGSTPVGSIIMWTGSKPPSGWALCDGQVASGIRTPDLRGRFLMGAGAGTGLTPRTTGDTGGEEAHALSLAEMPAHDHFLDPPPQSMGDAGWHTHEHLSGVGSSANPWVTTGAWWTQGAVGGFAWTQSTTLSGNHGHLVDPGALDTASVGGGQPHNNMPPFYVLAFIMRVQ